MGPEFVNIHTKQHSTDPVSWITSDGLEMPKDINFFFCIKHFNGGKI